MYTGRRYSMAADRFSRRQLATGSAAILASLVVPRPSVGQDNNDSATSDNQSILQMLLALAPDVAGSGQSVAPETRFSNLVPHLDLYGLTPISPDSNTIDPRLPAVFEFGGIPYDGASMMTNPERWQDRFGFHPLQIEAMLDQGPSDDNFLLLRGAFDRTKALTAWEATGYASMDSSRDIWRLLLDDDAKSDLAFEDFFLGFLGGSYDYVGFLNDSTIVLTSDISHIEQAQQTISQSSRVTTGHPAITSLALSMPNELSQAFILPGQSLQERGSWTNPNFSPEQREEMRQHLDSIADEYGPMPRIDAAILGRTPGGPYREDSPAVLDSDQSATYVASITPSDPAQSQECLDIATERLDVLYSVGLRERYRDLLTLESAQVVDGGIALMTFTQNGDVSHDLFDFYYAQDLQFLYW